MNLRTLEQALAENKIRPGDKVLVRLDLNVPLKGGEVSDDTRIKSAIPTLTRLLECTKKVAVMSHLGRPKGKEVPELSLAPIGEKLAEYIEGEVVLMHEHRTEPPAIILDRLSPNQILLLENTRFDSGEVDNDSELASHLSSGFDWFVNDAFGTMHRAHASNVGVTKFMPESRCLAGLLVQKECQAMQPLLGAPVSPFTVIMGGAKVSDKVGVILNLIDKCNTIIVGGAMAYTFLKFNGHKIGSSMVEEDKLPLIRSIYENARKRRVNILLPEDHVIAEKFDPEAKFIECSEQDIPDGFMGLDIGPKSIAKFSDAIKASKTCLWNGPMGVFEWEECSKGTMAIASSLAESSAHSTVGGGDSVAALNISGLGDQMSHISTGGGASLEFLEGKLLPGLKPLQDR